MQPQILELYIRQLGKSGKVPSPNRYVRSKLLRKWGDWEQVRNVRGLLQWKFHRPRNLACKSLNYCRKSFFVVVSILATWDLSEMWKHSKASCDTVLCFVEAGGCGRWLAQEPELRGGLDPGLWYLCCLRQLCSASSYLFPRGHSCSARLPAINKLCSLLTGDLLIYETH